MGHPLQPAGDDQRSRTCVDHIGITSQRQFGLNAVGLLVPVGRVTSDQLREAARLADEYGQGELRLTTEQNIIVPHIPTNRLEAFLSEPPLAGWSPNPGPLMRGLVACTGTDFCNLALIETKRRALEVTRVLEQRLVRGKPLKVRWSGCPAACGSHHAADIGLQGKRIRLPDGQVVEAVTVFAGGRTGPEARVARIVGEDLPCDDNLPDVLAELLDAYEEECA